MAEVSYLRRQVPGRWHGDIVISVQRNHPCCLASPCMSRFQRPFRSLVQLYGQHVEDKLDCALPIFLSESKSMVWSAIYILL